MKIPSWLAVAAVAAATVAISGAGAVPSGCRVHTNEALELPNGLYMVGTAAEFWQESNGHPGLQRTQSFCTSGGALPPDTCILHSETFAQIECGAKLADSI